VRTSDLEKKGLKLKLSPGSRLKVQGFKFQPADGGFRGEGLNTPD
jgi:hypothetical protein